MAGTSVESGSTFRIGSFTTVHWVAVVTAVVSAVIHLYLAPKVLNFELMMGVLFALAGLGYFGGIGIFLTKYWRRELYLAAALFSLAQIVIWVATGMNNPTFAYPDKAAQVVHVVAVAMLYLQDR
jgi:hypothetical protein